MPHKAKFDTHTFDPTYIGGKINLIQNTCIKMAKRRTGGLDVSISEILTAVTSKHKHSAHRLKHICNCKIQ